MSRFVQKYSKLGKIATIYAQTNELYLLEMIVSSNHKRDEKFHPQALVENGWVVQDNSSRHGHSSSLQTFWNCSSSRNRYLKAL